MPVDHYPIFPEPIIPSFQYSNIPIAELSGAKFLSFSGSVSCHEFRVMNMDDEILGKEVPKLSVDCARIGPLQISLDR